MSTLHYLINKQVCLWSQSSTASVAAQSCLLALTVISMVVLPIVSCHSLVTVVSIVNLSIVSCHFLVTDATWSYCQLSPVTSPMKKHLKSAMSSPLGTIQPRMSSRVTGCPSVMNIILLIKPLCT
jgi:hypothetical protein